MGLIKMPNLTDSTLVSSRNLSDTHTYSYQLKSFLNVRNIIILKIILRTFSFVITNM